jgi:hypothetical protein
MRTPGFITGSLSAILAKNALRYADDKKTRCGWSTRR